MSNVADISNYLLEQFYNESKELKEDILLENGIPEPLYKAYRNFNQNDTEKNLDKFLSNKTNNFSNDWDKGSKRKFLDMSQDIFFNKDREAKYRDSGDKWIFGDYGKVKYETKTIKQALSDLNINLTLNGQTWELDLNNMPENPKDLKATISNREDTKNKIIDYRFVYTNATYIQFAYIEEKAKIYPIVRGNIYSFKPKMERFNYTGIMFNSKLSRHDTDIRIDYIQNEALSIAWAIIFSDYIFKTNESEMLEPEGDRLENIRNRKLDYSDPEAELKGEKAKFWNYQGEAEQNVGRTRYNPYSSILTNVEPTFVLFKNDVGRHYYKQASLKSTHELYLAKKKEMLIYQHKLRNLMQLKNEYIENNLEDLYNERLEDYKNKVKISIEQYKKAKKNLKDQLNLNYTYAYNVNYKFKKKILTYYQNIENIYKEIKNVSDKLVKLQNYDFKQIQKEFGISTSELENKLIDVKNTIKDYIKEKERLQNEITLRRAQIEELQRQIQEQQKALENAQEEESLLNGKIKKLSEQQIQLESDINSDTNAVKEFYKKRIELNNKGKKLEQEVNRLKYEATHLAKEDNVIDYTKKSTAKPEDKERILNVLDGMSSLAAGLTEIKPVENTSNGLILDDEDANGLILDDEDELEPEDMED